MPRDRLQPHLFPYHQSAGAAWLWTLAKLALFLGACAGALYGYNQYALRHGGGWRNAHGRGLSVSFGRRGGWGGMYSSSKRF